MLRMTDNNAAAVSGGNEFINIDQKKRQITFLESSAAMSTEAANDAASADIAGGPSSSSDRAPMVSAPKIFAFDGLFTNNDPQVSIYLMCVNLWNSFILISQWGHPRQIERRLHGSATGRYSRSTRRN